MALTDKDIDSTMAEDWKDILARHQPEEAEHEIEQESRKQPEENVSGESTEQESAQVEARPRNEDGTFAPKSKESAAANEPVGQKVAPEAPQTETTTTPERDLTKPPSTWKPTARAEWEKLPPAIKAEVHRRETDWLNGQAQLLPDAKLGKSVNEIMAPYRMLIEAEGGTPERAIADLMRTAAVFRVGSPQQKLAAVSQIIQQFGIDITPLVQPSGQGTSHPPSSVQPLTDPRVDQLIAQLNAERQERARSEQNGLEASVTRWMEAKDEAGNPKYPYLGDVMNEMAVLVPQIRQSSPSSSHEEVLQMAYERATWGNPDVRPLLLSQQQRSPDNQNRVREAKRAASVNVPRRASIPSPGKPGTMDETIAATARELGFFT